MTYGVIKKIAATETYPLRSVVLRNRSAETPCPFDGDNDDDTIHLGYFANEKIVGIASFYRRDNTSLGVDNTLQLRGMAIDENYRAKGVGKELVSYAAQFFKNSATAIWCNARESAIAFYEKQGFETRGKKFDIAGIGAHIVMVKTL